MTITSRDITTQVLHSLNDDASDFDLAGIVDAIITTYGLVDTNTIDHDEYWALIARHAW